MRPGCWRRGGFAGLIWLRPVTRWGCCGGLCLASQGDFEAAAELVNESPDNFAGAYHLARQYEEQDAIKEAVFFYQRAKRFNHAARLAKVRRATGCDATLDYPCRC